MLKIITKRFVLILFGIFLSLILLECGLRLAGFAISGYQQYKNNKTLKNKSQYTIMCLGESTTAGQYPIQLQKILNKKYPNKFSVIDCGISGTSLEYIFKSLSENIDKYKPTIAICMMGINNELGQFNNNLYYNNKTLKILKLFYYFYNRYCRKKPKIYDTRRLVRNIHLFDAKLQKAVNLYYENKRDEAKIIFADLLHKNPQDEISYYFLATINRDLNAYINAINLNFSFMRFSYYNKLISHYKNCNNIEKMNEFIALACNDTNPMSINIDLYGVIKNLISEEDRLKIFKKFLSVYPKNIIYSFLSIEYLEQKNYILSNRYFELAKKEQNNKLKNSRFFSYYKYIIEKLNDSNIKVICMQYPVRSLKPVQEQLKDEPYYDKIIFISNEKSFKNALRTKKYNEIFTDQFAGDFGHCTDLGNTMIVENVVETLENILDLKNK